MPEIPAGIRCTESDEWVRPEGDDLVVGITAFAAEQLGDIVYVQLPEVGKHFESGEAFGEIESVKAVSDLNTPVAGEILDSNRELDPNPALVNDDPYGNGWMIRLRPDRPGEYETLLSAEAYEQKISEAH